MTLRTTQEIDELIANGQRLARQARELLDSGQRFLDEHNINPAECLELVRKHGGEAAVRAVEEEVRVETQRIEEEVQRRRMHEPSARPAGKRARVRANMV